VKRDQPHVRVGFVPNFGRTRQFARILTVDRRPVAPDKTELNKLRAPFVAAPLTSTDGINRSSSGLVSAFHAFTPSGHRFLASSKRNNTESCKQRKRFSLITYVCSSHDAKALKLGQS